MSAPDSDCDDFEHWMQRAIRVARRGWGHTHPNPVVGALVIEDGRIVAEGYHPRAGEPHAERQALQALGRQPQPGATLVVTLEPCSTHGRTPPCVDAIIEAGFTRVVVGAVDPNPQHAGRGLSLLREAGIEVISGIMERECAGLNPIFNSRMRAPDQALIAIKVATTLDGLIATSTGHSQWITGSAARDSVMQWRRYFPAILVGAGTVQADNPRLTIREGDGVACPERYVLDVRGTLGDWGQSLVFTDDFFYKTTVLTSEAVSLRPEYLRDFRQRGGRVVTIPHDPHDGHANWDEIARFLSSVGVSGVLVEPGRGLMRSLLKQRGRRYLIHYLAPKIIADAAGMHVYSGREVALLDGALNLQELVIETFAEDVCLRGWLDVR